MRTVQDVISRVQDISGDNSGVMVTPVRVARWATDAQNDIVRRTETNKADVDILSVPNQYLYPVAGGFLWVDAVYYGGHLLVRRSKREIDYMDRYRLAGTTGVPSYYFLQADAVNLYPTPTDAGVTIRVNRVPRPADLVNPGDVLAVPDEMFDQVVELCIVKAKEMEEDYQAAQYFRRNYESGLGESAYEEQQRGTESYPVVRDAPGENW